MIIPFYNRIDLATRAIRSVFAQTYSDYDLILVNDASPESDAPIQELIADRPGVSYMKLPANSGPGLARNNAIESARGRFVAFLDSDDTWEPDKLATQVGRMKAERLRFSHTSYWRKDTRFDETALVRSGRITYRYPTPAFHCGIATPTVVAERSLLQDTGFRADLRFAEDTFLWLELSRRTPLAGLDLPLTTVFVGDTTAAHDMTVQNEALRLLGQQGFAGRPLLRGLHALYRGARRIQRRLLPVRQGVAVRAPATRDTR